MQKENNLTAGQWCDHWFTANRHKWNSNTEGGYRNLIYSHIIPSIGGVVLSGLTKQTIINFYDSLRSQGLGARSVWCVHLLLRRCMDEAAQDQLIPYNPVNSKYSVLYIAMNAPKDAGSLKSGISAHLPTSDLLPFRAQIKISFFCAN